MPANFRTVPYTDTFSGMRFYANDDSRPLVASMSHTVIIKDNTGAFAASFAFSNNAPKSGFCDLFILYPSSYMSPSMYAGSSLERAYDGKESLSLTPYCSSADTLVLVTNPMNGFGHDTFSNIFHQTDKVDLLFNRLHDLMLSGKVKSDETVGGIYHAPKNKSSYIATMPIQDPIVNNVLANGKWDIL